ncbi:MAG TPA: 30S ribosomal protein S2 [Thermodesulfobacteriota bacterium]|nr:30S ribosomal protein S2 [Thermodesulfobacteriota bacterium]
MSAVTMKELLEAGVHFGHETKRWDPKMKPYIFGARNGIYIIDLQKTVQLFKEAYQFVRDVAAKGEYILFVGTKKQAQETISEHATRCGMFYVNHRWLGGMLTNFQTIKRSIDRLNKLEAMKNEEIYNLLPKKEVLELEKERSRLEKSLGGIKNMDRLPGAVFVVDPKKERIAVREARKIGIPSIGIIDTNCNPEELDYIIPGNDDAIRAIQLFASKIADAVVEGKQIYEKQLQIEGAKGDKEGAEKVEPPKPIQVEEVVEGVEEE